MLPLRPVRFIAVTVGALALTVAIAACGSANAVDPSQSSAPADPGAVHVQARGMDFATKQVEATAGKAFTIAFDNTAGAAPHNVDILDASGRPVFQGAIADPGKSLTYSVPALAPGTYAFRCDLHPDMKGAIVLK